jgi:hypothetical protein
VDFVELSRYSRRLPVSETWKIGAGHNLTENLCDLGKLARLFADLGQLILHRLIHHRGRHGTPIHELRSVRAPTPSAEAFLDQG